MRRLAALALSTVAVGGLLVGGTTSASAAPTTRPTVTAATQAPVRPVAKVDLTRYLGTWYQLAAIPAIFEAQCAKNVSATYTANTDGTIGVRNSCRTAAGADSVVQGTAKVTNPPANSALNVSFFSVAGVPVYGPDANYLIFGLERNYRWAIVGSADHKTGFVLSRTRTLPVSDIVRIVATIKRNGFDPCQFAITAQDGGSPYAGRIC